jgi:uncharacterized membrane protein YeaQ/YmgE (transglycosylase-associated protein family)
VGGITAQHLEVVFFALVWAVLIGGIEGWLFTLKHKGFGLVGNMLTAIMGAFLGFMILRIGVGLFTHDGLIYGIAALVGAIVGGQTTLRISRRSLDKQAP